MFATVTSKGQITLPAEAQKKLNLRPGTKLQIIVINEKRFEVIPVTGTVASLKGMVPKPKIHLSLTDMDAAVAEGSLA